SRRTRPGGRGRRCRRRRARRARASPGGRPSRGLRPRRGPLARSPPPPRPRHADDAAAWRRPAAAEARPADDHAIAGLESVEDDDVRAVVGAGAEEAPLAALEPRVATRPL